MFDECPAIEAVHHCSAYFEIPTANNSESFMVVSHAIASKAEIM